MQNPQQIEERVEARHRRMLMLWFAMLMSISLLLGLTLFVPSNNPEPNTTLSMLLAGVALVPVLASLPIKNQIAHRATANRDLLQSAYVVGFALCDSAALVGVVNHFVTGSRYYYFSFAFSVFGMLLHFPKKDHIRAATV